MMLRVFSLCMGPFMLIHFLGTFADIVIVYFEQIRVNSEKIPKLSHIIADRDKFLIGILFLSFIWIVYN